jgi:hypothetical protein
MLLKHNRDLLQQRWTPTYKHRTAVVMQCARHNLTGTGCVLVHQHLGIHKRTTHVLPTLGSAVYSKQVLSRCVATWIRIQLNDWCEMTLTHQHGQKEGAAQT